MVLLSQFDYDGETYADARNWLMFKRDRERFEEIISEEMDEEIHSCECDNRDTTRFKNDKTGLVYCANCGGVWKTSLRTNHY